MKINRRALFGISLSAIAAVMAVQGCGTGSDGAATTSSASSSTAATSGAGGDNFGGGFPNAGGGGASTTSSGATSTGTGIPTPTEIADCQGHVYACGDLIDNDSDGLIDVQDPDCLGPCDNTEDSLYGGIPGQSGPKCVVDCYFDQDSGTGNDDCLWTHECDPLETAPSYFPEPENGAQCGYDPSASIPGTQQGCDELMVAQSQKCADVCGPLTPNGCDCFGCCELPAGSGEYIWLGSEDGNGNGSCSLADVGDPTKCYPCTPVAGCLNDCDTCELCLGKTELPPECLDPDGGSSQCPGGQTPCGAPGQAECPSGFYCVTGCCQKTPS